MEKTPPVLVVDVKEPASLVIVTLAANTFTLTTCVIADVGETTGETVMLTAVGSAQTVDVEVSVGVLVKVGGSGVVVSANA
jgi:hypothetical protein